MVIGEFALSSERGANGGNETKTCGILVTTINPGDVGLWRINMVTYHEAGGTTINLFCPVLHPFLILRNHGLKCTT